MHSAVKDVCESRINYWAAYATDFSCLVIFLYLGARQSAGWPAIILSTLSGLVVFSFVEYAVHRWLLHSPKSALFYLHDAHHQDPKKISAFLFPTSFLLLMPLWCLLTLGLHLATASYFLVGLSGGYFYFDTLHHMEHNTRINQLPFRWLKKKWAFHSVHHRGGRGNFGVITPVWDYAFGTHYQVLKRRAPLV